ncbi:MAG: phosphotransferase [Candidatus Aenigmarchaeota archaeon]|nr:phosphotransferase [Candidatus Aenigmarchaeota archaeon]
MIKLPQDMMKGEVYDEKISGIELIQTHISWVFLTGEFAYKVKKPVNFGFLDFSTLEQRKKFCRREFEVNSKFSPQLYLDVLPITGNEKGIRINGDGETVEYCIKMKQIPQENLMTKLLEGGKIGKKDIDRIIDVMLRYYKQAESGPDVEKNATFEITEFNWDENFSQTEDFRDITIKEKDFNFIKRKTEDFMRKNKSLFEKRIKDRRVKWCHGDLHSGNIFIENGNVFIFDAIEFNERFACSDIANDVAFLAMDLDYRGFPELGEYLVRKYVERSGDPEIMKLIDFYKCYRAYVRGKVFSFRLNDESIQDAEKDTATIEARKYFELSGKYAEKL